MVNIRIGQLLLDHHELQEFTYGEENVLAHSYEDLYRLALDVSQFVSVSLIRLMEDHRSQNNILK